MAELAAVAGGSVIQVAVHDHTHTQTPAYVHEEHVLLLQAAAQVFSVGHGAGVVFQHSVDAEVFLQDAADAAVLVEGIAVAVAGDRIHTSGDAYADAHNLVPLQVLMADEFPDGYGDAVHGLLVGFHLEGDSVAKSEEPSLEIRHGDAYVGVADVHADEVARFRVESVNGRPAPAGGAGFAHVYHEALVHQFADEFGGGGDGCSDGLAEGGDALFSAFDAEIENGLFEQGIFVIFFL